jgi:NADH-quinone oxidoreductase subunit L
MFLAMGVGAYAAGIFHLYTHAFFKALLFLGSGAVIHALAGEQDIRNMGGLKDKLPITYWTFLIGSLAIAGVPLLSGFFSKDEILFRTFAGGHTLLWIVGMLTSLMTATYMFRLVFLTFHGERRYAAVAPAHPEEEEPAAHGAAHGHGGAHAAGGQGHAGGHGNHLHDAPRPMAFALIVLTLGSILAGYIGFPHALGGSNRLETWLEPSFSASHAAPAEAGLRTMEPTETAVAPAEHHGEDAGARTSTELQLMGLSSIVAFAGIGLAWYFFLADPRRSESVAQSFGGLRTLLLNKYYVDEAYDAAIVQPIKVTSERGLWKVMDAGIIDGLVNGTAESVGGVGELLRRLQTGSVRAYAASLLFGAVLVFGYYLWR